jgi:ATP-dependent Clp protease ATP-binding subunit ClpC
MFEKYTEAARKAVFFARYEASQSGSPYIEAEHLLLAILRVESHLLARLAPAKVKSLREQVRREFPQREKIATSVDLPVSTGCKRVFAYAAEEAKRLKQDTIGPDHLLLGISREESSAAARLLLENGVTTAQLRDAIIYQAAEDDPSALEEPTPGVAGRDLVEAADKGELGPLV